MTWPGREFQTPLEVETRWAVERSGRQMVEMLDQTSILLEALVGRAEAAERRELEREKQDLIKFRMEIAGVIFSFVAAVTGIIALVVAMSG